MCKRKINKFLKCMREVSSVSEYELRRASVLPRATNLTLNSLSEYEETYDLHRKTKYWRFKKKKKKCIANILKEIKQRSTALLEHLLLNDLSVYTHTHFLQIKSTFGMKVISVSPTRFHPDLFCSTQMNWSHDTVNHRSHRCYTTIGACKGNFKQQANFFQMCTKRQ